MYHIIQPANKIKGSLFVPGDKSISHRALMFGAIAEGTTPITNLSYGEDVQSTRKCLTQLGVQIDNIEKTIQVRGCGLRGFTAPDSVLDAGNSGTTIRLLSGILAAQNFKSVITGDESLQKRPMNRIIEPLSLMGVEMTSEDGKAPLTISGKNLSPINYISPVASAQIKSCVLLAGLHAQGTTTIKEPLQSRDHTERMLRCFGVEVQESNNKITIHGQAALKATSINVPGDISSAAFFMVAAAIVQGSELKLNNIGTNPTRTGIIEVLKAMGADIQQQNQRLLNNESRSDLIINGCRLKGTIIDKALIPKVIDEIPILAVAATLAEGETIIKDARELRVKETDRIAAIAENLTAMGAEIQVKDDGFIIRGPQKLKGTELKSFGDHRIAMAFSVAGLIAQGKTRICDSECAEISYPGFFNDLQEVVYE
jgi:3-phosphoshikimate 1-carboxyvinyltransferase